MANREVLTLGSLTALSLLSVAALVLSPSASGADSGLGPNHVVGEKLDSGLGEMRPGWTGAEQQAAAQREPVAAPAQETVRVAGEKLDSGLGEMPAYRAGDTRYRWASATTVGRASR